MRYICKNCGAESPTGIGYASDRDYNHKLSMGVRPAPGCDGPHLYGYDDPIWDPAYQCGACEFQTDKARDFYVHIVEAHNFDPNGDSVLARLMESLGVRSAASQRGPIDRWELCDDCGNLHAPHYCQASA